MEFTTAQQPRRTRSYCETCGGYSIHAWGNWADHALADHPKPDRRKADWYCTGWLADPEPPITVATCRDCLQMVCECTRPGRYTIPNRPANP